MIVASDGLDALGCRRHYPVLVLVQSTAEECVYALLKAVEDANQMNQDNTTIIVIDVKEKEKK